MSTLSPAAPHGESSRLPAVPLGDQVPRPPSSRAPASGTSNGSSGTQFKRNPGAGESRRAGAALKQQQREELGRIVAGSAEVGELLSDLGSDDVDRALAVIFAARSQLEQTERQLVRLAVQAGRSWARIGDALGIRTGRAAHERFGGIR